MIKREFIDYSSESISLYDVKTKFPLLELILSNKNKTRFKNLGLGYKTRFDMYLNHRVFSTDTVKGSIVTTVIIYDERLDD